MAVNYSFPEGASVNNGIDPVLCSLQYTSVHRVARADRQLGPGALLAKVDVQAAYRLVPVQPDDRPLLGMRWNGEWYIDTMLLFFQDAEVLQVSGQCLARHVGTCTTPRRLLRL